VPAAIDEKSVGCYGRDGEFRHFPNLQGHYRTFGCRCCERRRIEFSLVLLSGGGASARDLTPACGGDEVDEIVSNASIAGVPVDCIAWIWPS
jgi:hypothetical protein